MASSIHTPSSPMPQSPDIGFRRAADDDSTDVEGYLDHEEALVGDEPDQVEEQENEDKQQETNEEKKECEEEDEEEAEEEEGEYDVVDDDATYDVEDSDSPITSIEDSPCTSPADVENAGLQEESSMDQPNKLRRLSHGTIDVDKVRHAIFLLSELQREYEAAYDGQ